MPNQRNKSLNLPPVKLQTRLEEGIVKVFDPLRHKYVALTPEEFVRQHFTAYLRDTLGYPASIMANEVKVELNGMPKRCDTIVYAPGGTRPIIVIEYKAPDVEICQDTFDQIVRYNMILQARFLVVSNGRNHYCCTIDYKTGRYDFIPHLPPYSSLLGSEQ